MFIRTRPEKGSLVLGTYKVMTTIAEDSIYQWVKAGSTTDGNSVVLQIPQSSISQDESNLLFDYFETLQYFKDKKGFIVPDVQTDSDYPLVLIYSIWPEEILLHALRRAPKNAEEWWKAASEALHALHNKNLVHGHLNPDSFVVAEEQVYIRGFGYTPLLELGHKDAIKECSEFLAPEVLDKCDIDRTIDVYAFARTVAYWEPKLEPTSWYCKATDADPKKRLGKMREVFDELKKALDETHIDAPALKSSSGKGGSILVPKHTLTVTAEPSKGGDVKGGGHYRDTERVTVTAAAKGGWRFERWSGAVSGSDNPVTLTLNEDKTIVAHFTDLAALVPLEIDPPATTMAPRTTTTGGTKGRKSPVTFNPIKWVAVLGLVLGGVAIFNALSPHSDWLCRPLGTCSEFTEVYKQAKAEVNAARNVIQNPKSVEDLHSVRDRIQTAIIQLNEIPKNAKIYPDVQKTLSAGESDLTAIKAHLAEETKAQGLLNKSEAIATDATKQTEAAKSIQELEKAKAAWQQALEKLKSIPSGSLIADRAKARSQKYDSEVKQIEGRINELVAEARRRRQIEAAAREYSAQPSQTSNPSSTFNRSRQPSYRSSNSDSTSKRSRQQSYQRSLPQRRTSPPQKLPPLWGDGSSPSRSKPPSSDAPPLW